MKFNLRVIGNKPAGHAGERDLLHGPHEGESLRQTGDIPVARHQPPRWKGSQQGTDSFPLNGDFVIDRAYAYLIILEAF